ncbi:uncharacterized protein LOC111638005 [Centruroides sculpturatus]|uniref:uncharacterized protein LOC111638005 n=1 Tax=Centruroides sculpturatus TaxID=218467 RepID=UPI000C6D5852|nr:uncharacterized protein LOC111638005 [Centruroides sculpturatus]
MCLAFDWSIWNEPDRECRERNDLESQLEKRFSIQNKEICSLPNEEYLKCGSPCQATCDNYRVLKPCLASCNKGCFCKNGYVRNSTGECILKKECPKNKVNLCRFEGEITKRYDCENKCTGLTLGGSVYECNRADNDFCVCKRNLARHPTSGACVPINKCPNPIYWCVWDYYHVENSMLLGKYRQHREITFSIYLMVRANFKSQEASQHYDAATSNPHHMPQTNFRFQFWNSHYVKCLENEFYDECGSFCPETCDNYGKVRPCIQLCKPGCVCNKGFVRNSKNHCVPIDQCKKGNDLESQLEKRFSIQNKEICSLPNEEYLKCGSPCQATCDNYRVLKPCLASCNKGCFCKNGYVRNSTGECILKKECPKNKVNLCRFEGEITKRYDCENKCTGLTLGGSVYECNRADNDFCVCKRNLARHPTSGACVPINKCPNRKGAKELKRFSDLYKWEKQFKSRKHRIETLKIIKEHTKQMFDEARDSYKIVKGNQLKIWALQKFLQLNSSIKFTASDSWVAKFKKEYRLASRKITKLVNKTEIVNEKDILVKAARFQTTVKNLLPSYSRNFIFNTDQCGFSYEMISPRTLSYKGEKHTIGFAHSPSNKVTHSYTVQYLINANGQVVDNVFICLQEAHGTFGPRVQTSLFNAPNVTVTASSSDFRFQFWNSHYVKCLENEFYDECGSFCPETCDNYGKVRPCIQLCKPGCVCNKGFVRNSKNHCVPIDQCKKGNDLESQLEKRFSIQNKEICSLPNEEYLKCGSPCQATCDNYRVLKPCLASCNKGCFCKNGYVRNSTGECILKKECPKNKVNLCRFEGEITKRYDCENKCTGLTLGGSVYECNRADNDFCVCKRNLARHPTSGACVPINKCPNVH